MIPGEVQAYITMRLAHFASNSQVRKEILERFEIEATLQQLSHYNPTNASAARSLSKELRELFWETRKEFLEKIENIPIANAAVRLKRLNFLADKARAKGEIGMEAQIIEQAAKEVGGMFQNTRRLVGKAIAGGTGMIVPVFMVPDNGRDLAPGQASNATRPKMLTSAVMIEGVEILEGEEEPGAGAEGMAEITLEDETREPVGGGAGEEELADAQWDEPGRVFDAPEGVAALRHFEDGYS